MDVDEILPLGESIIYGGLGEIMVGGLIVQIVCRVPGVLMKDIWRCGNALSMKQARWGLIPFLASVAFFVPSSSRIYLNAMRDYLQSPLTLTLDSPACYNNRTTCLTLTAVCRRYAALNGDINPIHMHSFLAIQFGFRSNVAHGMFLLARCISAVQAAGAHLQNTFILKSLMLYPFVLHWT